MAVKTYFASGAQDPSVPGQNPLADEQVGAHAHHLISRQTLVNGDSATSTITFGNVPSNARISRNSRLDIDAMAGNTSFSLGNAAHTTGLMNAVDVHAGGQFSISGITNANADQPLWKILGYASDPGGELTLLATLGNALTGGGDAVLTLVYGLAL